MKITALMAVAMIAAVGILTATGANAAVDMLAAGGLANLAPLAAVVGAGGIARIACLPFGPRIAFEKPNEGGSFTVEQLAEQVKGDFQKAIDSVKAIAEEALGKSKAGETLTTALKEKADEGLTKMNELMAQVTDLEQKAARKGGGEPEKVKSVGEQFVEADGYKLFAESNFSRTGKADLQIKANITSLVTDAPGSAGPAIATYRDPEVVDTPKRTLTVRDLLTNSRTTTSAIEYVKKTGFTNSAAPTAEGVKKPQSDLQYKLETTSTKVIAHFMKASRQILSDVPRLRSDIDNELIYGLKLVEEAQILNGDNTGQNLHGIIPQATAYSPPSVNVADLTIIDVLRLAMLQAALAEYPATGHVLNPIDWTEIELSKDSIGRYIIGNPQGGVSPSLWRLPVVATQAMTYRKFLTGAFKLGATIYDQWDSRVEAGYENDDFTKNMVTLLAEERLALAVKRPESFIYGDFDAALSA